MASASGHVLHVLQFEEEVSIPSSQGSFREGTFFPRRNPRRLHGVGGVRPGLCRTMGVHRE